MPPRIAYWTSSFRPEMEAVAAEVACLRAAFPGSITWGVSARDGWQLSWKRGFGVPPSVQLAFRATTWVLQRAFDLNHIFGGLGDWFHLRAVVSHPTLLTMAVSGGVCDASLLEKVDNFVVEWPAGRDILRSVGIEESRIQLVFPAVDLQRFAPRGTPPDRFTVLFASSPDNVAWIEGRGVPLILGAAVKRPDMLFRLVWRPWGDSLKVLQYRIEQLGLRNVEVIIGRFEDMSQFYQGAHVTIAPFTSLAGCKPTPNSIVESLASGRPVVVTDIVGIAELIADYHGGEICTTSPEHLADMLDRVSIGWDAYSRRARDCAERHFDSQLFVSRYGDLYRTMTQRHTSSLPTE